MLILLISLGLGAAVGAGIFVAFGLIEAAIPALLAAVGLYFFLSRRVGRQMQQSMLLVQSELQKGRVDQALKALEAIKHRYGKWQFFTEAAVDGQIGSIHYLRQDWDKAKPYLQRAFGRHWVSKAMLGVLHYKKKDYSAMDEAFEKAAKYSPKQGLLWSVWAWCHWKGGHPDRAIDLMLRGKKFLSDADEQLNTNLLALQNGKKMKMKTYGEQWYQFHLEKPPAMMQQRQGRARFARR
jgi:tetratricopeptide (TPR) repeat protein